MITLGINEFFRNLKDKIVVILQMTIVYVIAIFVTSSFIEQYKMMGALDGFLDETGIFIDNNAGKIEYPYATDEMLYEDLVKIEDIVTAYRFDVSERECVLVGGNYFRMETLYYDLDKIDYRPKLIKGDWCEDYTHTEGIINIVISNYFPIDISVGETFEISGITFRVTGIYDEKEPVLAPSVPCPTVNGSYLDFYEVMRDRNEVMMAQGREITNLAFVSYEDMKRENIEAHFSIVRTIDYEDDISKEEMSQNIEVLAEKYGYVLNDTMRETKEVYDYSNTLLSIKITPMLFIFVVVFVVSAASLITSGAINVLYEKRNYGIYFTCGNDWSRTLILSLINWICIAGTSLILAVSATLLMKSSGEFENLALSFGIEHILVLVTITIIMLLLALVLPYRMLKKLQPVNILKDNDK